MEKLVVGNLKMNILSPLEREQYFKAFKKGMIGKKLSRTGIVLCPPAVHLEAFKKLKSKKTDIGAQNMFWERAGSYTGEISPAMIKNLGAEYVIVGHSERRHYFCEKNEEVNLKVVSALRSGLNPIICVGETKTEKAGGQTLRVVSKQVKDALTGVSRVKAEQIIIAYEPVWAIGSGTVPTAHEVMEAKVLIRKILVDIFDKKYANLVKILYGGSVNAKTVKEVCVESGMDGALIGGESLIPFEFIKIAEIING